MIIVTRKGKKITLRKYPLSANQPVWFKQVSYRSDGYVQNVNVAGVIAVGSDDPWWLVTNLKTPESAIGRYYLRFRIEEWFKDLKHRLRIADLQTKSNQRIRRLMLVAVIAYGFLLLTGKLAKRFTIWYDWLITGRQKSASIVWLAIQVIKSGLAPARFWHRVWAQATFDVAQALVAGP